MKKSHDRKRCLDDDETDEKETQQPLRDDKNIEIVSSKVIPIKKHKNDDDDDEIVNACSNDIKNKDDDIIIPHLEKQIDNFLDSYVNETVANENNKQQTASSSSSIIKTKAESNFSIISLLNQHKLFERTDINDILPKTNILKNDQFLKESRKIISFSLINNKLFQTYLDVLKKLDPIIQVSNKFKELDNKSQSKIDNLDQNQAVESIIQILKEYEVACEYLLKEIPGLTELPVEYQTVIIKRNLIDLFIITMVNYYENGELMLYLDNGYHFSRQLIEKLRGKTTSDLMYNTYDILKELNVTEREKAILLAYIFTLDDENFTNEQANKNLKLLNEFYKAALMYEFELVNRDNDYVMKFEELIKQFNLNREIQYKQSKKSIQN